MSTRLRHAAASRTSVLLLGQVVAAGAAFGINILAAKVMAPADRGVLALALQLSYMATTAALLGVESPYVARRSGSFPQVARELVSLMRLSVLLPAAGLVTGMALYLTGHIEVAVILVLGSLYAYGNTYVRAVRAAYIASNAAKPFLVTAVVSQIVLLALAALLVLLDIGDPSFWVGAYIIVSLPAVAILLAQARGARPIDQDARAELAVVRRQGLRLLPASFGNTAMLRSDRLLLPALASVSELGLYIVVATAMEIAGWPVKQWVDSSLRRWREQGRALRAGLLVARATVLALALSLVGGGVTYVAVVVFLPEPYRASTMLIPVLGCATTIYAATRVQQGLLVARGQSTQVSIVEISGMLAAVAMYVALIPTWGAMGAAMGSVIGYAVCLAAGAWALHRSPSAMDRSTHSGEATL
ncbi:MAG: polysaccharide biosynthesis C-terminal domain-containing protein [Cellulomonas sp.]|uniref:lipopolysaccharide biosynthesis protein n=1 Tax=Cellulomonas sp. TaxID=40001 RepID=UPI001A102F61|nr:polysaccharide biosynthesis C-terminal domain-containing protein [Cellulomonas sp.]MBF0689113.1 polysaccharide biosynthesis C-terminal domain-containing protein [Cellulomonas sp.]